MFRSVALCGFIAALSAPVSAATNEPIQYPDGSMRYAYGYSGIDFPSIPVQPGRTCTIMLEPGEQLTAADANDVLPGDRVRWTSVVSRSGGQRLANGQIVPTQWSVTVEPAADAHDTDLTIHTALGRHYFLHLVPVHSGGEMAVSFFYYHVAPSRPRLYPHRQAITRAVAPPSHYTPEGTF